jgi:diamine N-acetyltransferase
MEKQLASTVSIRIGKESDAGLLSQLCTSTFLETYIPIRTVLEQEFIAYTRRSYSEEKIKEKLLNPKTIYLIAEIDSQPVGYCHINLGISPKGDDKKWIYLEEVYLTKANIGKGVGKRLMEEFLQIAKKQDSEIAWLGVWEGNKKAIDFYIKWGFEIFDKQNFKLDKTTDIDLLMKKEL